MGAVGLLLTIAGLYGLVAYNVSRRTREIGIRIAIGAGPRDVLRLVMGKGLVLVGIGTAIGLAMGSASSGSSIPRYSMRAESTWWCILRWRRRWWLVTMLAAYVPARRAARIAPTQALRYE